MSFRAAAAVVRERAQAARRRAEQCEISEVRAERFRAYLHGGDIQALEAWINRRVAQELDTAANDLQSQASEDVTVLDRPPRG